MRSHISKSVALGIAVSKPPTSSKQRPADQQRAAAVRRAVLHEEPVDVAEPGGLPAQRHRPPAGQHHARVREHGAGVRRGGLERREQVVQQLRVPAVVAVQEGHQRCRGDFEARRCARRPSRRWLWTRAGCADRSRPCAAPHPRCRRWTRRRRRRARIGTRSGATPSRSPHRSSARRCRPGRSRSPWSQAPFEAKSAAGSPRAEFGVCPILGRVRFDARVFWRVGSGCCRGGCSRSRSTPCSRAS